MANDWITERERTVIDSPFIRMIERDCHSSEDGRKHKFYLLQSRDWCNIIPITEEGHVVLVRQYRVGVAQHTLEIPGGVVDPSDVDPSASAVREMEEETGYVPAPGAICTPLGWNYPNPAIQDNRCHSFVIGPVRKEKAQKLDYGEMIEVIEVPLAEIPRLIRDSKIVHSLMLNTFFQLGLQSSAGVDALLERMSAYLPPNGRTT